MYYLIIVSSTIIVLLCLFIIKLDSRSKNLIKTYNNLSKENSEILNNLKPWVVFNIRATEAKSIKNLEVSNIAGERRYLAEIINQDYKIVFSYTALQCDICIDSILHDLIRIGKKIGNENIIILASYVKKREAAIFLKEKNINIPFYFVDSPNFLNIEIE